MQSFFQGLLRKKDESTELSHVNGSVEHVPDEAPILTLSQLTFPQLCEGPDALEKVQQEMKKGRKLLDERDSAGKTLAHYAAMSGTVSVLRWIQQSKSELLETPDQLICFPIHEACEKGHINAVKFFITFYKDILGRTPGAIAKLANGKGITPFHVACANGNHSLVDLFLPSLMAENYDINFADCDGLSPFHHAMRNGKYSVAYLLLTSGAVAKYEEVNTLLQWAMGLKRFQIVENLLRSFNADPNTTDQHGLTVVELAAAEGDLCLVQRLVGLDSVNADAGKKAYAIALRRYEEAMQEVVEAGWTPRFSNEAKLQLNLIVKCLAEKFGGNISQQTEAPKVTK